MGKQKEVKIPENWDNLFSNDLSQPERFLEMEKPDREKAIEQAIQNETLKGIAEASRKRNFASPNIQQPDKELKDGQVVDKPRSRTADPFTRGFVGSLTAPVRAISEQYEKPVEYSKPPKRTTTGNETADMALEVMGGIAGMLPAFGVAGSAINSTRLIKSIKNPVVKKLVSGGLTFPLASSPQNVIRTATGEQTPGETAKNIGEESALGTLFGGLPSGTAAKNVLGTMGAGALGYGSSAMQTGTIDPTKENLVNAGVLALMHATGMVRPKDKLYDKRFDPSKSKPIRDAVKSKEAQNLIKTVNKDKLKEIGERFEPKPFEPKPQKGLRQEKTVRELAGTKEAKVPQQPINPIDNNRPAVERMAAQGKGNQEISKALNVDETYVKSVKQDIVKQRSEAARKLLEDREFTGRELNQEFRRLGEKIDKVKDLKAKGYIKRTDNGYKIQDEYKALLDDIVSKPERYDIDSQKLYSNPIPQMLNGIDKAVTFADDMWQKAIGDRLFKTLGKGVKKITPKKVRNELLQENIPQEYISHKKEALESIERWKERANELGNLLLYKDGRKGKELTRAEQLRLTQIIKGSITKNPDFKKRANQAINELKDLKKIGTELEVLPVETYNTKLPRRRINELLEQKAKYKKQLAKVSKSGSKKAIGDLQNKIANTDKKVKDSFKHGGEGYFKRVFLSKEQQKNFGKYGLYNPTRLDLTSAMQRKDIPEKVRKEMGEVLTASYPTAKAVMLEGRDVSLGRFFEIVNERADWSSTEARQGFTQLPTDKRLGKLSGKYVEENIARDIQDVVKFTQPETMEKFARDINNIFKLSKTVMNPSTHARNIMSQSVMNDFAGVSHARQASIFPEAIKAWRGTGKYGRDFKASGLKRTTFVKGELNQYLEGMESTQAPFRSLTIPEKITKVYGKASLTDTKFGKTMARIYQAEEEINKAMLFVHKRQQGASIKDAKDFANKWGFDYGDVPRIIRKLRTSPIIGKPFITWTYKAFPRVLEAAITRPLAFWKYPLMFGALTKYSLDKMDVSEDDWKYIQSVLPERMSKGEWLLLPFKDANNKMQMLDLTYILPYKDVYDVVESSYTMATQGETNTGDALIQAATGVIDAPITKSLIEITANKNVYNNMPIWYDVDSPGEKTRKALDHIYKTFMPPLTPEIPGISKGGYSYHKLRSTMTGREDYYSRSLTWQQAFASSFAGIKTSPVEVNKFSQRKEYDLQRQIQELGTKRNRILRDQTLSEEERMNQADEINERMQKIRDKKEEIKVEKDPTKERIRKMIQRLNGRKSRYPYDSDIRKEMEQKINELKIKLSNQE